MSTAIVGDFILLRSIFGDQLNQENWLQHDNLLVHSFPKNNYAACFNQQKGLHQIVFLFWVKDLQCMIKDYKDLIQAGESYFKGSSQNVGIILLFEKDIGYKTFIESVVAQTPYYKKYYLSNRIEPWITGEALNWDSIGKLSELSESLGRKPPLPLEKQNINDLFSSRSVLQIAVIAFLIYFLFFKGSSPSPTQANEIVLLNDQITSLTAQITTLNVEWKTEKELLVTKLAEETKSKDELQTQVTTLNTQLNQITESNSKCEVNLEEKTKALDDLKKSTKEIFARFN